MNAKTGLKLFIIFCCLFELVKGNCLNYGHSCWGAHGKRSVISLVDNNKSQKLMPKRIGFFPIISDEDRRYNKYNVPEMVLEYMPTSQSTKEKMKKSYTSKTFELNKKPLLEALKNVYHTSAQDNDNSFEDAIDTNTFHLYELSNEDIQG